MSSIYVGNLPYTITEADLEALFLQHGEVRSVKLIIDHATGRPRGFGFVEMDKNSVRIAIKRVNGNELGGRTLRVKEAHHRPPAGRAHRMDGG